MAAVAPRYASWPETPCENVNVLCEGPSIGDLRVCELLDGPVVAINHTIALSSRIPIDFWATIDDPLLLWDWAQPHLGANPKVFSTENNISFWLDLLGDDGFNARFYGWQPTYMDHLEPAPGMTKPPVLPTIIPTLAWIAHLQNTVRVRVFGCDMVGMHSDISQNPYSSEEDEGWEYRWTTERQLLSLVHKKYRERGKRLERWARVPHGSRNLLSLWSRMQRQEKSFATRS